MLAVPATVAVNGHNVPDVKLDLFLDGKTGQPVSDEQWDKQRARLQADNLLLVPEEFR